LTRKSFVTGRTEYLEEQGSFFTGGLFSVKPPTGRLLNVSDLFQFLLFLLIVTLLVKPLGGYMGRVSSGKRIALDRWCLPEKLFYRITRITRVDPHREMTFAEIRHVLCAIRVGQHAASGFSDLVFSSLRSLAQSSWGNAG
jgi:hypothetical protein